MNEETITETTNGINIEANQLSIDCITSNQNNFHLDSEGNLTVKSIQILENNSLFQQFFEIMYPIGSIYMSVNDINPTTIFGGTWEAWGKGKVPVGVDASQAEFNTSEKTGGEKEHTLTIREMPNHSHPFEYYINYGLEGGHDRLLAYGSYTAATHPGVLTATGGSESHNNLQPYITCYMWKRVA